MGKKDDKRSIDDLYELMEEILEEQRAIRKLLEAKSQVSEVQSGGGRVFLKGKYKGKTPEQVLDIDPAYIEFIYKTFILQQTPQSAEWNLVTERHFNAALSRSSGGRTPGSGMTTGPAGRVTSMEEEEAPSPSKKKKPVPKPPEFLDDDIPF